MILGIPYLLFVCDSVQASTYVFFGSASDFRMADFAGESDSSLPSEEPQAAIAIIHVTCNMCRQCSVAALCVATTVFLVFSQVVWKWIDGKLTKLSNDGLESSQDEI